MNHAEIKALFYTGMSQSEISRKLVIGRTSVRRILIEQEQNHAYNKNHFINFFIYIDLWCATRYTHSMIKSFKHKGLKQFFEKGDCSGIQSKHENKLRLQLAALDTSTIIEDMDLL